MRSRNSQGQQEILPRKSKPIFRTSLENKMPFLEQDTKTRIPSAVRTSRPADAGRRGRRGHGDASNRESIGQSTMFEDRTNIQHWAASSARGSGQASTDFNQPLSLNVDPMLPSSDSMFTGYEPDMTGLMNQSYPEFSYSPESSMFPGGDIFPQSSAGSRFSYPFATSEAPLMEFTASAGGATSSSRDFHGSDASFSGSALSPTNFWMETSSEDGIPPCLDMPGITYEQWSPSTASVDLSLSPGCPSGSLMSSNFLGSPVDLTSTEELTPVSSNDELLQFTIGQSALSNGSYDCFDVNRSASGLDNTYQAGHPVQLGYHEVAYANPQGGVRAKAFYSNRLGSDGENIKARQHEVYNVGPGPDGLYHCPYVNGGDCKRKPDKLKCNYDKHMDSHLKPYRCQDPACSKVPFSSTACLLRHEREAHGLHGHGDRPYSCFFDGCERAGPGYGFPRRWNLQDHMRRVHKYVLQDADCNEDVESSGSRKKKSSQTIASSRRAPKHSSGRSRA